MGIGERIINSTEEKWEAGWQRRLKNVPLIRQEKKARMGDILMNRTWRKRKYKAERET